MGFKYTQKYNNDVLNIIKSIVCSNEIVHFLIRRAILKNYRAIDYLWTKASDCSTKLFE